MEMLLGKYSNENMPHPDYIDHEKDGAFQLAFSQYQENILEGTFSM